MKLKSLHTNELDFRAKDENSFLHHLFRYDGEHLKGADDEKWVTYQGYSRIFSGMPISELRLAPNAMDALMACRRQVQQ